MQQKKSWFLTEQPSITGEIDGVLIAIGRRFRCADPNGTVGWERAVHQSRIEKPRVRTH